MNWLHYLAEANLYLAVFYLAYRVLLAKETYNQLNRVYLLFACVAAFVLPVLQLGILKPAEPVSAVSYSVIGTDFEALPAAAVHTALVPVVTEPVLNWQDYLVYAYAIGCCVLLLVLLVKLFTLIKLISNAKRGQQDNYKLIYLPETDVAFSFFNYLFIGTDASGANTIIRHELVHINQKHSLDILFLEILKIINWFNPFIYLLQNSLKTIHEYIADEQTAAHETDPITYSTFLVNNAYGAGGSSITHSFFNYNLLKKRIIMLNQQRSGSSARLKYLITVPLCAGLLCASTLAFSKDYGFIDLDPAKAATTTAAPLPVQQQPANNTNHKLPPPAVFSDSYKKLNQYLTTNVHYDKTVKGAQSAVVVVTFRVKVDHKIGDAAIEKSGGTAFDAIVMRAFQNYTGEVADNPGNRKFIFNFYGYNHSDKPYVPAGGYKVVGNMVIVPPTVKFPPPRPAKLIVVDGKIYSPQPEETVSADSMTDIPANTEWAIKKWGDRAKYGVRVFSGNALILKKSALPRKDKFGGIIGAGKLHNSMVPYDAGTLFIIDGKKQVFPVDQIKAKTLVSITCDSLTVYKKGNAYARSQWGNDVGKVVVLHGNASVNLINRSVSKAGDTKSPTSSTDKSGATDRSTFYKYIADNIKYPIADRRDSIGGMAYVEFSVDDKNELQVFWALSSPSDEMIQEVFRVMKENPALTAVKGTFILPIRFDIADESSDDNFVTLKDKARQFHPFRYNPYSFVSPDKQVQLLNGITIRAYLKKV